MVIKAVVFDYGGVIITYRSLAHLFTAMAKQLNLEPEAFLEKKKEIWEYVSNCTEIMSGHITAEEYEETSLREFMNKLYNLNNTKPLRFAKEFIKSYDYNEKTLKFLKILMNTPIRTALLTNNYIVDREQKLDSVPVDRTLFDVVVESCKVRTQKPLQKIYEITHSRLLELEPNLKKEEVLFIDDVLENIEAAEKFGWRGIQVLNVLDPNPAIEAAAALLNSENGSEIAV